MHAFIIIPLMHHGVTIIPLMHQETCDAKMMKKFNNCQFVFFGTQIRRKLK